MRAALWGALAMLGLLTGCATTQLSPAEIARLKGGTTTVVVYGFCVPMDHLIKTAITRHTLHFEVDGQRVGSMQSCSFATFRVKSGYWSTKFVGNMSFGFGHNLLEQAYRPGATQYLHMYPAGQGSFYGKWVDKAEADRGIAEIKKIGQMF